MEKIAWNIGSAVQKAASNPNQKWYSPHMAAASRAISHRIPLVDILLEIRDARIPFSSECELLRKLPSSSSKRIVVMNKMDLASPSRLKEWITYFDRENCMSFALNSHNKDSVKQLLNFLQAQVRELKKAGHSSHTTTIMLVGIPNAGKSAIANSLHQIGRISAAEKGKLRHAMVSPRPGETKDISSLKIGSHPNIFVLDTPSILPPKILDTEVCSKLALTGAIQDSLVGVKELATYFLSILNTHDEYKKWEKLSTNENERLPIEHEPYNSNDSKSNIRRKKQLSTDHTQDLIVEDVRRTLFETVSCYDGDLSDERDLAELIKAQFIALSKVFHVSTELDNDAYDKVGYKLLNLYRTGRLGHYNLDCVPKEIYNLV